MFKIFQQLTRRGVEGLGDLEDVEQRNIPLPALNSPNVCTVKLGEFCQLFLGNFLRLPELPYALTKFYKVWMSAHGKQGSITSDDYTSTSYE